MNTVATLLLAIPGIIAFFGVVVTLIGQHRSNMVLAQLNAHLNTELAELNSRLRVQEMELQTRLTGLQDHRIKVIEELYPTLAEMLRAFQPLANPNLYRLPAVRRLAIERALPKGYEFYASFEARRYCFDEALCTKVEGLYDALSCVSLSMSEPEPEEADSKMAEQLLSTAQLIRRDIDASLRQLLGVEPTRQDGGNAKQLKP